MSEQTRLDLTDLQCSIIFEAIEHPEYTHDQISSECACSRSTVGRTLRRSPNPVEEPQPSREGTNIHILEKSRYEITIEAIIRFNRLLINVQDYDKLNPEVISKINEKQTQSTKSMLEELRESLTRSSSVEEIKKIIKSRQRYYPTRELLNDILDACSAGYYIDKENAQKALSVLNRLSDIIYKISNIVDSSNNESEIYSEKEMKLQYHINFIQDLIESENQHIIDPPPREKIMEKIDISRSEMAERTAIAIHNRISDSIPTCEIIAEYHQIEKRVAAKEMALDWHTPSPVGAVTWEKEINSLLNELHEFPEFRM
jgi:hypothetical protein